MDLTCTNYSGMIIYNNHTYMIGGIVAKEEIWCDTYDEIDDILIFFKSTLELY